MERKYIYRHTVSILLTTFILPTYSSTTFYLLLYYFLLFSFTHQSSSLTGNSMRYALMNPSILPSITPSTSVV